MTKIRQEQHPSRLRDRQDFHRAAGNYMPKLVKKIATVQCPSSLVQNNVPREMTLG